MPPIHAQSDRTGAAFRLNEDRRASIEASRRKSQFRLMSSLSAAVRGASSSISARGAALDLIGAVLRQKHPLDEAIDDHPAMVELPARDRAFARLLVATVLRRLGQIDALIEHCLEKPLPARASATQDLLRLGLAQLLFLRTPPHAAVATSVDLAEARGFLSYKGLVNAVLRRLSQEGPALIAAQDEARLTSRLGWWQTWPKPTASDGACDRCRASPRSAARYFGPRRPRAWRERLDAILLPTGTLRRQAGGPIANLPGYDEAAWWVQDAAAALPAKLLGDVSDETCSISAQHPAARRHNSPRPERTSSRSIARRAASSGSTPISAACVSTRRRLVADADSLAARSTP